MQWRYYKTFHADVSTATKAQREARQRFILEAVAELTDQKRLFYSLMAPVWS